MSRPNIEVSYAVEAKGPLHIGTGRGAAGLHRAMLRDQHGHPYLPGSTIKGRARFAAMRICEWMGVSVLKDTVGQGAGADGHSPNGPHGVRDLPNRIFGCAWSRCTLRFSDARTEPPPIDSAASAAELRTLRDRAHGLREVRTGTARSRMLGTVSHRRLYQSEVAPPGLTFQGTVQGHLECKDDELLLEHPVEILVLWLALHLMVEDGVGSNKSAGNGKLVWAPGKKIVMKVDGRSFSPVDSDASAMLALLPDIEPGGGAA